MVIDRVFKRIAVNTAKLALPLICVSFLAAGAFYNCSTSQFRDIQSLEAHDDVINLEKSIGIVFTNMLSDLDFLLSTHKKDGFEPTAFASTYLDFMSSKPEYDQLRYLDTSGKETFRINQNNGAPTIAPAKDLQDKSHRYYFTDAANTSQGSIYASALDLNIEQQQIEKPLKPMLRLASPMYDNDMQLESILILNCMGATLLSLFDENIHEGTSNLLLLNGNGYWLKGTDPAQEWGFMYDDQADMSFAKSYPFEWSKMAKENNGLFMSDNGLFAFQTMSLAHNIDKHFTAGTAETSEQLKIVAHIPTPVFINHASSTRNNLLIFIIPLSLFLLGGAFTIAWLAEKNRRATDEILKDSIANERFVPKHLLQLMGKDNLREVELSQSVQREMAVLFSDIRSYTKLSESMHPKSVFELLNNYFSRIDTAITARSGFIDKFIGDAVMALFPEKADDSLRAAIAMRNRIDQFNQRQEQENNPPIHTGFGLHYGEVTLGSIGTMRRMQTTAIGDTVNLAARLESATKAFKTDIIISDAIYDRLENPDLFRLRKIDTVRVKGKEQPVTLYEAYDVDDAQTAAKKDQTKEAFSQGLALYAEGNFDSALELFTECHEQCPEDSIPPIYIKRCNTMKRIAPGPDWAGISTI